MASTVVLWVYVVLLITGGVVGWLKAGSKISITSSVGFAVPLVLAALGFLPGWVADVLIAVLLLVFVVRFAKGQKLMPAGLMIIVSALTVLLRRLF